MNEHDASNSNATPINKCESRNVPYISGYSVCSACSTMRSLPPRTISPHMPRLEAMVTRHLPSLTRTLSLQILRSTLTYALILAYVARPRSTRYWCNTLRLILVPLTHTRVWRNKLYLLLSLNLLGLHRPQTSGSLSLGAIPPHMSGLLAMVAHHLPILTGNPNSSH